MAVRAIRRTTAVARTTGFIRNRPGRAALWILGIAAAVDIADLLLVMGGVGGRVFGSIKYHIGKNREKKARKAARAANTRLREEARTNARQHTTSIPSRRDVDSEAVPLSRQSCH
jgi:hypothetical protein